MVKDVLSAIDYSMFAEGALVLFGGVFVAVVFSLCRLTSDWSRNCAAIPLEEHQAEGQEWL